MKTGVQGGIEGVGHSGGTLSAEHQKARAGVHCSWSLLLPQLSAGILSVIHISPVVEWYLFILSLVSSQTGEGSQTVKCCDRRPSRRHLANSVGKDVG